MDVVIPKVGESITTVFIARFVKQVGDSVSEGEPVLEIDSDKASMEVPAPTSGVLTALLVKIGDEVPIGAVVAQIEAGAVAKAPEAAPEAAAPEEASRAQAGPAARQAALESGVDLGNVQGSGRGGRVLSRDVRAAASQVEAPKASPAAPPPAPKRISGPETRVEVVPMSPLRRTIARRLVEAQQTAAMLTTFNEIDMSAVLRLRKEHQDRFVARYGLKLGFMSFFVKATIEALKEYPSVNAEVREDSIAYKHYFNIGVAVSGPKGLVVPIVRDADRLSFADTEKAIGELAGRARDNKLRPDDFEDGTFTISNGGVFGSLMSTPILNPPQVGILGMHAIVERPIGVEGRIELRPMMYVALSYDHRIIDGREAVGFLKRVKELVEAPERILLEV